MEMCFSIGARQTSSHFKINDQHSFNIQEFQTNWLGNSCLIGTGLQDVRTDITNYLDSEEYL